MTTLATPEGTRGHAERHDFAQGAYRTVPRTGLVVSALGFGCYRVDEDIPEHVAALEAAVLAGCNLIDTSTNYGDGGSERAVGRALRSLFDAGSASRDQVVVVSKVGYVQGENLQLVRSREAEGSPYADVVKYADGCWHCIHPAFIADQIARSLSRLALDGLDACLLHNPEYFLSDAAHRHRGSLAERRDEFYRRIRAAFEQLEAECDAGRIGCYGVSSNTFVAPASSEEATSLSRMVAIAREVAEARGGGADSHRFAFVQLPFNLYETGAVLERNNGEDLSRTVLEEAPREKLAVLVNRPLNAFAGGALTRLADFPARAPDIDVPQAAARVKALEAEFAERIAPGLEADGPRPRDLFAWGRELEENSHRFSEALHWRQVEHELVRPRLEHAIAHVPRHLVGRVRLDWADWLQRYRPAMEDLLAAVGDLHREAAQRASDAIARRLDAHLPEAWRGETLSRKAIAAIAGTPGVTSVLVGMRCRAYVRDAMGTLTRPAPRLSEEAWQAVTGTN